MLDARRQIGVVGMMWCAGFFWSAVGQQSTPYYGPGVVKPAGPPVRQQQYDPQTGRPCGGYMMAPCKTTAGAVTVPPGATGEQVYQMAVQAEASHNTAMVLGYLQKSAELGYATAQAAIGEDYLNGRGEPKDQQKAIYWLNLAAVQGNRAAESLMGEFYEYGMGVNVDQAKAVHFYMLSADQHYGPAEEDLGLDYEFGRGVVHNRGMAIALLKRAAADGNDQIAADYASALERAKTAQFHNEQEIVAFEHPAPPLRKPGQYPAGCGVEMNYNASSQGLMKKADFCQNHPGCPYQSFGQEHICGQN